MGHRHYYSVGVLLGTGLLLAGCGGSSSGGGPSSSSSYVYSTSYGSATNQLSDPDAIALDATGNIYVADFAETSTPRITKFDTTGKYLLDFGNTGQLTGPQGVFVDASGNTYVADANSSQVVVFDSSNKLKTNLLTNQVGFPYQINGDASGNFFVTTSTALSEVIKFDSTGKVLATIGAPGTAGQALNDPDGVALDSAGNIYVSDYGAKQIVEYTSAGAFVKAFGNTGTTVLKGPQGIAISASAGIFVADITSNRIFHFDQSGNFLETIGDSSGSGALASPYDVTLDKSGNLLVVDSGHNRIAVFKPRLQANLKH